MRDIVSLYQKMFRIVFRAVLNKLSRPRFSGQTGQIAVVLLLVVAAALVLYGMVLNIDKTATTRANTTIAATSSAGYLVSQIASWGQKQFKETMGGRVKKCKGGGFGAIIGVVIAFVLFVLAVFIPPLMPVGVQFLAGAVLVVAGIAVLVNTFIMTVIVPGQIVSMWNKMMAKRVTMKEQTAERGIQIAMQNLVEDRHEVPDILDIDGDGKFGFDENGKPRDMMSRYSLFYTARVEQVIERAKKAAAEDGGAGGGPSTDDVFERDMALKMAQFQDGLADFLYDNPKELSGHPCDDPRVFERPHLIEDYPPQENRFCDPREDPSCSCCNSDDINNGLPGCQGESVATGCSDVDNPFYDPVLISSCDPLRNLGHQRDEWGLIRPVPARYEQFLPPLEEIVLGTVSPEIDPWDVDLEPIRTLSTYYFYPRIDEEHPCQYEEDKEIPSVCNVCCQSVSANIPDFDPSLFQNIGTIQRPNCCDCASRAPRAAYLPGGSECFDQWDEEEQAYIEFCPKDPLSCNGSAQAIGGAEMQCGVSTTCDDFSPFGRFSPLTNANYPFVYDPSFSNVTYAVDSTAMIMLDMFGEDDSNPYYYRHPRHRGTSPLSTTRDEIYQVPHSCGKHGFRLEDALGYPKGLGLPYDDLPYEIGTIFPLLHIMSEAGMDLNNQHPEKDRKVKYPPGTDNEMFDPLYNRLHQIWLSGAETYNAKFHQNYYFHEEPKVKTTHYLIAKNIEYITSADRRSDLVYEKNGEDVDADGHPVDRSGALYSVQTADKCSLDGEEYAVTYFACEGRVRDAGGNVIVYEDACNRANNRICDWRLCAGKGYDINWDDRGDCSGEIATDQDDDGIWETTSLAPGFDDTVNPYILDSEADAYGLSWDDLFPPALEKPFYLPIVKAYNPDGTEMTVDLCGSDPNCSDLDGDGKTVYPVFVKYWISPTKNAEGLYETRKEYVVLKYMTSMGFEGTDDVVFEVIDGKKVYSTVAIDKVRLSPGVKASNVIENLNEPPREAQCAQQAFNNSSVGFWRSGYDKFCSTEYPYDQGCLKHRPQVGRYSDITQTCMYGVRSGVFDNPLLFCSEGDTACQDLACQDECDDLKDVEFTKCFDICMEDWKDYYDSSNATQQTDSRVVGLEDVQDCVCTDPETENTRFPDDLLDDVVDGIKGFVKFGQILLNQNPDVLADRFADWYPQIALFIEASGDYCRRLKSGMTGANESDYETIENCYPCLERVCDYDLLDDQTDHEGHGPYLPSGGSGIRGLSTTDSNGCVSKDYENEENYVYCLRNHFFCAEKGNTSPGGLMFHWVEVLEQFKERLDEWFSGRWASMGFSDELLKEAEECLEKDWAYVGSGPEQKTGEIDKCREVWSVPPRGCVVKILERNQGWSVSDGDYRLSSGEMDIMNKYVLMNCLEYDGFSCVAWDLSNLYGTLDHVEQILDWNANDPAVYPNGDSNVQIPYSALPYPPLDENGWPSMKGNAAKFHACAQTGRPSYCGANQKTLPRRANLHMPLPRSLVPGFVHRREYGADHSRINQNKDMFLGHGGDNTTLENTFQKYLKCWDQCDEQACQDAFEQDWAFYRKNCNSQNPVPDGRSIEEFVKENKTNFFKFSEVLREKDFNITTEDLIELGIHVPDPNDPDKDPGKSLEQWLNKLYTRLPFVYLFEQYQEIPKAFCKKPGGVSYINDAVAEERPIKLNNANYFWTLKEGAGGILSTKAMSQFLGDKRLVPVAKKWKKEEQCYVISESDASDTALAQSNSIGLPQWRSKEEAVLKWYGLMRGSSWHYAVSSRMRALSLSSLKGDHYVYGDPRFYFNMGGRGWLGRIRQSALEAENQVAKMRRRLWYFELTKQMAQYVRDHVLGFYNHFGDYEGIIGNIRRFLSCEVTGNSARSDIVGAACRLIKERLLYNYVGNQPPQPCKPGEAEDPEEPKHQYSQGVVYGWRSGDTFDEDGNNNRDGRWHLVRVDVRIPEKGVAQRWPRVKSWKKRIGKICYGLRSESRAGNVYVRVTKWDEPPEDLKFPMGLPIWNFRFGKAANSSQAETLKNLESVCVDNDPLHVGNASLLKKYPGLKGADIDGAFLLNAHPPDTEKLYTYTPSEVDDFYNPACEAAVNKLLPLGVTEVKCGRYELDKRSGYRIRFLPDSACRF